MTQWISDVLKAEKHEQSQASQAARKRQALYLERGALLKLNPDFTQDLEPAPQALWQGFLPSHSSCKEASLLVTVCLYGSMSVLCTHVYIQHNTHMELLLAKVGGCPRLLWHLLFISYFILVKLPCLCIKTPIHLWGALQLQSFRNSNVSANHFFLLIYLF